MNNNINKLLEKFEELQENMGPASIATVPVCRVCRVQDDNGGYEVFLCAFRIPHEKKDEYAIKLINIGV